MGERHDQPAIDTTPSLVNGFYSHGDDKSPTLADHVSMKGFDMSSLGNVPPLGQPVEAESQTSTNFQRPAEPARETKAQRRARIEEMRVANLLTEIQTARSKGPQPSKFMPQGNEFLRAKAAKRKPL